MPDQTPTPPPAHSGPLTALQLIDRIIAKTGAPDRATTVDRVVAGDPTQAVTGVAVTGQATLDVLHAAAAGGHNLIVTFDSPFWSGDDDLDHLEGDPLYLLKRDFIRANRMVCLHLHDHWIDRTPGGLDQGMAETLGWGPYVTAPSRFRIPPTTLEALASTLAATLRDPTLRVVGDPRLPVQTVAANWGDTARIPAIRLLNGPEDVVLVGYAHEWEGVEYAQDMVATGAKKGLVLLGEGASIQGGMKWCAEWIRGFTPEVPVAFVPATDPFWPGAA